METRLDAFPPELAAETLVWLASAPEAGQTTGGFFHDLKAVPPARPRWTTQRRHGSGWKARS